MTIAAKNTIGMPPAEKKKPRKPYKITRPREKWAADEHDRFLHALFLFGRDWKAIAQLVATKTATQIRSHAQKYFLKAHKLGLAAALPPPHPRRAAVLGRSSTSNPLGDDAAASMALLPPPSAGAQQISVHSSAGACWPSHDGTVPLPLSPDDPRFAEVCRFVGDVFGSGAVEAQLQRLHGMDPVVAETILLVLKNLEDNLSA